MPFVGEFPDADPLRGAIEAAHRADETARLEALLGDAAMDAAALQRVADTARGLVEKMRRRRTGFAGLDDFLGEYGLSNSEGVVLMCLAEALLRIPDAETANRLIRDKIVDADWEGHLGASDSLLVNASTWALMLTGRVVKMDQGALGDVGSFLRRLVAKGGEPLIRRAMTQAMRILGRQFVMGRTIEEALERARGSEARGYRYSYDMLGEAARTAADAERYMEAYSRAIAAVGGESAGRGVVARGRACRSSSRRCIPATSSPSANGSWVSSCPGSHGWSGRRRRRTSGCAWTPRKRTGWTCRWT